MANEKQIDKICRMLDDLITKSKRDTNSEPVKEQLKSPDFYEGYKIGFESAQPKWISVEERLPDDLEEVLILVKETEFYGQYKEFSKSYFCQYIGCVDDGEWFTVWCHGHRYIKNTAKEPYADKFEVTHWMPLPEPPKEG